MLVFRLCDERAAFAAYRRVRYTWMLMLANTLHLFALPLWADVFHAELTGGSFPGLDVGMLVAPTRLIHHLWLSRLHPLTVDGAIGHVATYRRPPHRQFAMHPRDIHRFAHAYWVRLTGVAILLVIGVIPTYNEASPSFGHHPSSVTFYPVEIYLPLFVVIALILLVNAPTQARFFGPHQQTTESNTPRSY